MGLRCAHAAIVAVSMLAWPAAAGAGQEPYWESKPLSYWVTGVVGPGSRSGASSRRPRWPKWPSRTAAARSRPPSPGCSPTLPIPLADVRESAAHALEQIGAPAARPAVAALLRLLDTDTRRRCGGVPRSRSAGSIPPREDVITGAARTLRDDRDIAVRVSAAVLLMASGRSAGRVSNVLTAALTDDSHAVRLYSAAALVKTPDGQSAFPRLLDGLQDDDAALRAEAVGLLADAGRGHEEVMPALVRALGDSDAEVRGAAADALGAIGKPARPVLPAMWPLLRDPDEAVRDRVVRAVRAIKQG